MKNVRALKYIIASIIIISMLVFTNKVYATTATVNTETLNLRKEASTDSNVVELLSQDDKLEVISQEGDWYQVKHGDNTGYVKKEYIKINEDSNNSNLTEGVAVTTTTNTTDNTTSNAGTDVTTTTNTNEMNTVKVETKIRLIPSINANNIGIIELNKEIEIISRTNKWAFVQYEDITGWIPLTSLDVTTVNGEENIPETNQPENNEENNEGDTNPQENLSEPEEESQTTTTTYENKTIKYVNTSSVYVRSKATTNSDVVTTLIKNTDVTVLGEEGEWYKVTYNNLNGYIRKDLLSDTKVAETTSRGGIERENTITKEETTTEQVSNNSLGEQIVSYAKQYLGCPYVYGGSGSSSFDCSGFTMYVYKHFGYSLSHSATAQSKCGSYVSKDNLQPGDLVFFLDYETMDGIGHCGIYIGNGDFIHASSGSGYCVKISTLLSGSYYNRYATARRLI